MNIRLELMPQNLSRDSVWDLVPIVAFNCLLKTIGYGCMSLNAIVGHAPYIYIIVVSPKMVSIEVQLHENVTWSKITVHKTLGGGLCL